MATNQGQQILRKLTIKETVGNKAVILAAAMEGLAKPDDKIGKKVAILRIIGQCTSIVPGETENGGAYVKLKGQFEATNLLTGEQFRNVSVAILPNMVGDMVAAAIMAGAQAVDFAVEIDVQYNLDAITMYEYSARSLLKPVQAAPVTGILAMLAESGVTLTAPRLAAPKPLSDADKKKQEAAMAAADKKREDAAKATKGK